MTFKIERKYLIGICVAVMVIAAYAVYEYKHSRPAMACCLVNANRQRICINVEYLGARLNMTVPYWASNMNCTSRTAMCEFDPSPQVNMTVCPENWWK